MESIRVKMMSAIEFSRCLAKTAHLCDGNKAQYLEVLELYKAAIEDQIKDYTEGEGTLAEIMTRQSEQADANLREKYGEKVVTDIDHLVKISRLMD